MSDSFLSNVKAKFLTARILVVGDVMLDRYLLGVTTRISPEAPVPVVKIHDTRELPGGAANVARNIASLGAKTRVLGVVGEDPEATALETLLSDQGVKFSFYKSKSFRTTTKTRVVAQNQQIVRLDFESEPALEIHGVSNSIVLNDFVAHLDDVQLVVVSDYLKGTVSNAQALISTAKDAGKFVIVDPKGDNFDRYFGADIVKPNLIEFERVVGACKSEEEINARATELRDRLGLAALLLTRGAAGMTLFCRASPPIHLPSQPLDVYDVTGAGDTVIAVLAVAIASGVDLYDAVMMSNLAAGIAVGKFGAASVGIDELESAITLAAHSDRTREVSKAELLTAVSVSREKGERIVMTNGCFDILHPGHVSYLRKAKALGDRLIVAINGDASIRRLKGPSRPINPLSDRMKMLGALSCVDWVVSFDEDTPKVLYESVLPDVLVKGSDYKDKEVVGADIVLSMGGEVVLIELEPNYSTTGLVNKIRARDFGIDNEIV